MSVVEEWKVVHKVTKSECMADCEEYKMCGQGMKMKIGDIVVCDGDSGFCDRSEEKIVKITIKYDESTGEPYDVIHIKGGQQFDSRDGCAITPPYAYYIKEKSN